MSTDYDLIIVGGGMVGASLSLALAEQPLRIALIEAYPLSEDQQPNYDDRGIALSYGSQRIFETMGLWSSIEPHATPIKHIHVSDRGHFGVTRISAEQEQVPALGQVVIAKAMGHELNQALLQQDNVSLICPATVTAVTQSDDSVSVQLDNQSTLTAKLLVAADGKHSTIRDLLGVGAKETHYGQTAITANITPERAHQNWAYERFTDTGPLAFLPMSDNRCSLVWTQHDGEEQALMALSDEDFLVALQQRFGYRLGRLIKVGKRHTHPLTLLEADHDLQHRVVFIGNASHSLHPIAGQGFNLGLRDVTALAEVISENKDDCGNARALHEYRQWRDEDQQQIIKSTDMLVSVFSNANPIFGHLRAAGLSLLESSPTLKSWLAAKSMGLTQKLPKLNRGIKL